MVSDYLTWVVSVCAHVRLRLRLPPCLPLPLQLLQQAAAMYNRALTVDRNDVVTLYNYALLLEVAHKGRASVFLFQPLL